ncbi:hypothetical protein Ae201684_018904 [Aphanomyces euteiches]|nr:hypothetical protein Ae201684_018904 [Aphanomyces euteiches]
MNLSRWELPIAVPRILSPDVHFTFLSMASTLYKLSSILDCNVDAKPAFEHGVACHFTALENPSLMERIGVSHKAKTHLSVQINTGRIALVTQYRRMEFSVCDVHFRLHGKKDVFFIIAGAPAEPYTFASRLFAVEFTGGLQLVQHINALKTATALPDASHDMMLKEQVLSTLEFGREMWTLAMWNKLYPYSGLVQDLQSAAALLDQGNWVEVDAAFKTIYDNFHMHAAINKVTDGRHPSYYRPSHMTLLMAKVKALRIHLALYI